MSAQMAIGMVAAVIVPVMALLWYRQLSTREADVVDLAWTVGLGGAAVWYAAAVPLGVGWRRWMVAAMAGLWSLRLAAYLFGRVRSPGEDGRYRDLRVKWGRGAPVKFFVFFQAQAALVIVLSVHFLLAMRSPDPSLGVADLAGVAIWLVSLVGESVADRQLERFRTTPGNEGRVCQAGLWRYSRHPNYFFEWLHWLAYVPVAHGHAPLWAILFAPVLLLLSIRFVTGIPPIERRSVERRGEEYRRYQRTTSALIPWFPRRDR
ncbi:MAG: DUF1295 domain-containing protein [Gemmatimonadota bacterium]|nr:DUF1295 domain-containing protein [Gemmatimonadota bacterium]